MAYKFQIRSEPGRAMRVLGDLLLALACFGALQALETTASTNGASPSEPAGALLSAAPAADPEPGLGGR